MKRFAPQLRRIEQQLDLPQPVKGRILLEIASDMEDLLDVYLAQGVDEEEAGERVAAQFDLPIEAIRELEDLHRPVFRRVMERLSAQAQSRWEKGALLGLLVIMSVVGLPILYEAGGGGQAGITFWPVLAAGLAGLLTALTKVFQLFIKRDHRRRGLRQGMPALLTLAIGSSAAGLFGFSIELYLAIGRLRFDHGGLWPIVFEWLQRGAPVLMLGLLLTMVTALFWFSLIHAIQRIEQSEVSYLLGP
ncbi:hypothetical protein ACFL4Y_00295 [Gemmatimonadota bacterium]